MRNIVISFAVVTAIFISLSGNAQEIHKSVQKVKNGEGKVVDVKLLILSEQSEGAFMKSIKSDFTDLVCCGESMVSVSESEKLKRFALRATTRVKSKLNVPLSWNPSEVIAMWSEDYNGYFATVKGTSMNKLGVRDNVSISVVFNLKGEITIL
jgi:hypothetical protein